MSKGLPNVRTQKETPQLAAEAEKQSQSSAPRKASPARRPAAATPRLGRPVPHCGGRLFDLRPFLWLGRRQDRRRGRDGTGVPGRFGWGANCHRPDAGRWRVDRYGNFDLGVAPWDWAWAAARVPGQPRPHPDRCPAPPRPARGKEPGKDLCLRDRGRPDGRDEQLSGGRRRRADRGAGRGARGRGRGARDAGLRCGAGSNRGRRREGCRGRSRGRSRAGRADAAGQEARRDDLGGDQL